MNITRNIVLEYDNDDYEITFSKLMKNLGQGVGKDASDFLQDDFVDGLRKHFPKKHTISRNHSTGRITMNLLIKWLVYKRKEYSGDDEKFEELFETVKSFEKRTFIRFLVDYEFEDKDFIMHSNSIYISDNLKLECIYEWNSLFPKLKSIYTDFYQKGHDCKRIINDYFKGNLNNDPLLQFAIRIVDGMELNKCACKENINIKSSRIYSSKELNELIDSNLFIKIYSYNLTDDDDLITTIQSGNKIQISGTLELKSLLERYEKLGLWNKRYISSSLLLKEESLDIEYISFKLREIYIDKSLAEKLEKWIIKE